jgi:O-methyltransferase
LSKGHVINPRLAILYQELVLRIPKLPELRIGNSKIFSFIRAWHYLEGAGVRGDYLEFGVFEGVGFRLAMRAASKVLPREAGEKPRFFAFDSFGGLPSPDPDQDAQVFEEGDYTSTRTNFDKNIRGVAKHWSVDVVTGYFSDSLVPELYDTLNLRKAAFVTIDCDLYPSTQQALDFLTPVLQTGTVMYFDDWFTSNGDMRLGEAGACRDWLARNPDIELVDYGEVGIMGKMFLVNRAPGSTDK